MRASLLARRAWVLAFISSCLSGPLGAGDPDVIINEILYNPPEGYDTAEFIELHNQGVDAVDLEGRQPERRVGVDA